MPRIVLTPHLYRFFPVLQECKLEVPQGSVADVLKSVDHLAPGFSDYLLDERGSLRRHVNVAIDGVNVVDRSRLSDWVGERGIVHVFQALSGG